MPRWLPVIVVPLISAAMTVLMWVVVNKMLGNKRGGFLETSPWPLSDMWMCAAGVGGIVFLKMGFTWFRDLQRGQQLESVAGLLGLRFESSVSPDAFHDTGIRFLSGWNDGFNRVSGEYNGLQLDMLDYMRTVANQSSDGTSDSSTTRQTLVIIPLTFAAPRFELLPRGIMVRVLGLMGVDGLRFQPGEGVTDLKLIDALQRFDRKYFLSGDNASTLRAAARQSASDVQSDDPDNLGIAACMHARVLQYLADHPGWSVESSGTHLAFWRKGKLIPATQRQSFLDEISELVRLMSESPPQSPSIRIVTSEPVILTTGVTRRMLLLFSGGAAGLFLTVLLFLPLMFLFADRFPWIVFLFPVLGMVCMVGGLLLVGRFLNKR